jgi:hypothetical protein
MSRLPVSLTVLSLASLLVCACNTNEDRGDETDTSQTGDTAGGSDVATPGDTTTADTASGKPEYTPVCTMDSECAGKSCVAGVCVTAPKENAVLSDPNKDNLPSPETALELGCVGVSVADQLKDKTGPKTVTMWGRVDRFGGGGVTVNVQVDVFKRADFHPEKCNSDKCLTIEDELARDECMAEVLTCLQDPAKVGTPIATTVSIDPDEAAASGLDVQTEHLGGELCLKGKHLTCPSGYECRKGESGDTECIRTHGIYAVENVPTGESLVVRVRGLDAKAKWYDSYYWDLVVFPDRADTNGASTQPSKYAGKDTFRFNPTIVGQGQWTLVPNTMGLNDIRYGYGVIGGRIRDCGKSDGRGGWPIHKATVGLGVAAQGIAYFNDNEDDTVPVKTRIYTDTLGRFAAVDVPPGPNRLAAMVKVDDKVTPLGGQDVYVVPNSLTIISTPGRVPVLSK